ncbi:MAG TPA: hypothetical protein VGI60_00010 [Chthoniobacterales bacterium]|jgi:hypothetical protein
MSGSRQFLIALSAIPVGGIAGFVCAAIIVSACVLFGTLYDHTSGSAIDWQLRASYVFTTAVVPGAVVGALSLAAAYLILFRTLSLSSLFAAGLWIAVGVLGGGLLASSAQEFFALIATMIGFAVGCRLAYVRPKT